MSEQLIQIMGDLMLNELDTTGGSSSDIDIGLFQAYGPGPCPLCGKATVLRVGFHGEFYGCTDHPVCCGSRQADIFHTVR